MDMTVRHSQLTGLPTTISNVLDHVPATESDFQALRVQTQQNLARVFDEVQEKTGVRPLFIPAGAPAVVWQCDDNNPFWGQYSPWVYCERPNRSMKASIDGPVVGWFQGAIHPLVEFRPEPIYHPDDKDIPVSQTEAVLFFRVRFVKTGHKLRERTERVPRFTYRDGKLTKQYATRKLKEIDEIESAKPARAVVTVGCTL